jgi:hypothetical protein
MQGQWLSACAIVLLTAASSAAQERPVFTGTWESDGTTLVITDTPALFTVERRAPGGTETLSFAFIGESKALERHGAPDGIGGPTAVQETTAKWHEDHLDTSVARLINGKTVTQTVIYTMEPGGSRMTVQRNLQIHHGYEGPGGGQTQVTENFVKR